MLFNTALHGLAPTASAASILTRPLHTYSPCLHPSPWSHSLLHLCMCCYPLWQRFSSGVPQEVLKHAIPHYLVRGTALFSLRPSNRKENDNSPHNNSYQCECPVLNHKYIGHIIQLYLIGHVA